jgi:hypothetical protein
MEEERFEGGLGPEGAAAPYLDGVVQQTADYSDSFTYFPQPCSVNMTMCQWFCLYIIQD